MSLIERYVVQRPTGRWGELKSKGRARFECDSCGLIYDVDFKESQRVPRRSFCSVRCKHVGDRNGLINADRKETLRRRYGVNASSQVPGATQKMIESRVVNTGAACPSDKSSSSNRKYIETMQHRHGVASPLQSPVIRKKSEETLAKKHGVPNALSRGSPFRPSSEDLSVAGQKGYAVVVAKPEGQWILSRPEKELVQFLKNHFGENDIDCQVPVKREGKRAWLIDARIKSLNVYVQLDGIFWHGLDKPYEDLHPYAKKAYDKDRIQDAWFESSGLRLVRITDKEFLLAQKEQNFSEILYKLGGCSTGNI